MLQTRAVCVLFPALLALAAVPAQSRPVGPFDIKGLPKTPDHFADPIAATREYVTAFRAHDEVAMQRVVDQASPEKMDWFRVAHELLHMHAASGAAAAGSEPLAAARSLAGRVGGRPQDEALPDLVAAWQRMTAEDLRRELALREQFVRLRAALDRDAEEALAIATELSPAAGEGPDSCTRAMQWFQIGMVEFVAGHIDRAAASMQAALDMAGRMRWHYGRAEILIQVAMVARSRGDKRRAMAINAAERALRERLGHHERLAQLLLAMGDDHIVEGAFESAQALYAQGKKVAELAQDRPSIARARFSMGCVHKLRLEREPARACFQQCVQEFEALGDDLRAVRAKSALGLLVFQLGDRKEGMRLLEGAATTAKAKARSALPEIHTDLGDAHRELGQSTRALGHYRQAWRAALAMGDAVQAAASLGNVGMCLGELGRYAEAIDAHERCIVDLERSGRRMNAAEGLVQLGALRLQLRDYAGAIPLLERAIAHLDDLGEDRVLGSACHELGVACSWLGENERAIAAFERARATYEKQGNRRQAANAVAAIGKLNAAIGQPDRALEILKAAQERMQELGDRGGVAWASRNMAFVHASRGDHAKALELLDRAVPELEALGEQRLAAGALEAAARSHVEVGHAGQALAAARKAMAIWDVLGRDLAAVDALASSNRNTDASYLGLWAAHLLASTGPSAVEPALAEALWFVESGRGRVLASGLVNREAMLAAHVSPELYEGETSARASFQEAQQELVALLAGPAADAKAVGAARTRLDAAYRGLESVVARTQREASRVAAVVHPQAVGLVPLRAALRPDEALLLYLTGERHAFVAVIGKESGAIVDLGDTEALAGKATAWIELLAVAGSDEEGAAAALYDLLLRPLEGVLAGKRRLLISPEGVLTFLPFEALLRREGAVKERVLERWETAYVPSATVLVTLRAEVARSAPGQGLLALGDPVYPGEDDAAVPAVRDAELRGLGRLRRLRGAGDEVRAIGALFPEGKRTLLLRADASVARLQAALQATPGRLAAAHFACHGHVDLDRPRLTGLVLAGGEMLTLDSLYREKIPADLAVLSACETAKGRFYRGEGVVGLVRGFFFAGCPRVVVSNWRVDDEGTRALMVELYRQLLVEGLVPTAALRAAKLARLRSGPAQAHPFHWAAFVSWGLPD